MNYGNLKLEELQYLGMSNDQDAILELGRRALDMDFCMSDKSHCKHSLELIQLQQSLETEIPPQCPHCSGWLTEK